MSNSHKQLIGGRYELGEVAGSGGMATVYRGVIHGAAGFSQTVAIKKMRREFRHVENYIHMFIEEARVGSELQHTNIVQVYDFLLEPDGTYYLVMEWVEGMDLHAYIAAHSAARVQTEWAYIATVALGALHGLAAAHERSRPDGSPAPVIHRDISPQNIMLGVSGAVKLTDFGLARARDRAISLTAPGMVKGKMSYLAPEITHGKSASVLSDQFSLGSVLWQALAGRRPFEGKNDMEVFKKIRACQVEPLGRIRRDVPSRMIAAVHRAMAADPSMRFSSAREMAHEFEDILGGVEVASDWLDKLGHHVTQVRAYVQGQDQPSHDALAAGSMPRENTMELNSAMIEIEPDELAQGSHDSIPAAKARSSQGEAKQGKQEGEKIDLFATLPLYRKPR